MASFMRRLPVAFVLLAGLLGAALATDIPITWVAGTNQKFNAQCGDNLVFKANSGLATVVQVKAAACTAATIKAYGTAAQVKVPLTTAGTLYFRSAGAKCALATVTVTCAKVVANTAGMQQWTTGAPYNTINAKCGDSLLFQWPSGQNHDVVNMTKANYDTCNFAAPFTTLAPKTLGGSYTLKLTSAGTSYIACSVGSHCWGGQQKVTIITTC